METLGNVSRIALLKCDIEGSEFDFIENYPSLLEKVSVAVFEFHRYGRDVDLCRQRLQACGFRRERVLRTAPLFSIESYIR